MKRPLIFCLFASFSPFNLWRCGRLICVRLLFAVANNCLCQIIDFENKFSVIFCQTQQSTIATASLGLLKPAEVVSRGGGTLSVGPAPAVVSRGARNES